MPLKIQTLKITGKPDSYSLSQIYENAPIGDTSPKKGQLYMLFAGEGFEGNEEAVSKSHRFFSQLVDKYYKDDKDSPLLSLKKSVKSAQDEVLGLNYLQVGMICFTRDLVYLVSVGGCEIYLFRSGVFTKLLSSQDEIVSASGRVKKGDVFVAVTPLFFKVFSKGIVKASLNSPDFDSLSEYILPHIHSQQGMGKMGILGLRVIGEIETRDIQFAEKNLGKDKASDGEGGTLTTFLLPIPGRLRLKSFGQNIREGISKSLKRHVYFEANITSEREIKRRKTAASLGFILITLLISSIFFGIKKKQETDYKESYNLEISSARHNFDEASTLYSLNASRARELFIEGKKTIDNLAGRDISDPELTSLKEFVKANEGKMLGEYHDDPQLFVDLGLLSGGFVGDQMILTGENIYVLDTKGKIATKTSVSNKHTEVVAGSSKIDANSMVLGYLDKVFTMTDDGLYEIDGPKKKILSKDWEDKALGLIYAGNLYVLEKNASAIWRYTGLDSKFGERKNWLASSVSANFQDFKSWIIDGSIWILMGGNKVTKLASGNTQNFIFSGIDTNGLRLDRVFASDESKSVYFLNKADGKVYVFSKDGVYQAVYINDVLKETESVVVSEKGRRLILLNGSKLYAIELKHLD